MKSLLKKASILAVSIGISACATPPANQAVVEATAPSMAPDFECALYYSQVDDSEKIDETIDSAVSIGEKNGLSIPQITGVYGEVKKDARARVLEHAIELAATSPDVIPRLDGSPPPPNAQIELQAWKDLFQERCTGEGSSSSTT